MLVAMPRWAAAQEEGGRAAMLSPEEEVVGAEEEVEEVRKSTPVRRPPQPASSQGAPPGGGVADSPLRPSVAYPQTHALQAAAAAALSGAIGRAIEVLAAGTTIAAPDQRPLGQPAGRWPAPDEGLEVALPRSEGAATAFAVMAAPRRQTTSALPSW